MFFKVLAASWLANDDHHHNDHDIDEHDDHDVDEHGEHGEHGEHDDDFYGDDR